MAFTNIGSAEVETLSASHGAAIPIVQTIAIPDLGTHGVGWVALLVQAAGATTLAVDGATWGGQTMTLGPSQIRDTGSIQRAYFWFRRAEDSGGLADNGNVEIQVTFSAPGTSTVTTYQLVVGWFDGATEVSKDSQNAIAGSTSLTGTFTISNTQAGPNELLITASVTNNNGGISVSGCTLLQGYDSGPNCSLVAYSVPSGSGEATHTHIYAGATNDVYLALAIAFKEAVANQTPTLVPNTADAASFTTTTPGLEATATDTDADAVRYNVQVSDNPVSFAGGSIKTDSHETGSGTVIHPNPDVSVTTWEGHIQVDDRPGQVFRAKGGILDNVEFYFGAHETFPVDTNGSYLCHIYEAEGYEVGTVPAEWVGSTSYSVGNEVRPTSVANGDVHFVYRCTVGGASGESEPTWPLTPDDTVEDGGATWTTVRCAGPKNPAIPSNTPTPGWVAVSDVYAYSPGVQDGGWKTLSFSGANRIRLTKDVWYVAILDWRPANRTYTNTLAVASTSLADATHQGNCYLDAAISTNNGPRIIDDLLFRVHETFILLDKTSGTDSGFLNTVNESDTDPFNSGEKVKFTVQAGDELSDTTYYWRARVSDPNGSNTWSDWTTARSFTVTAAGGPVTLEMLAFDPDTGLARGTVLNYEGQTVQERGFVWATHSDPTVDDNKTIATW